MNQETLDADLSNVAPFGLKIEHKIKQDATPLVCR